MATTALIGIHHADGTIETIKCWHDGYPDHMGPTLTGHYDTPEKANALIAMGDINFLDITIELTAFEHRNRKTAWDTCKPQTCRNLGFFLHESRHYDYSYFFYEGKWNYYDPNE